MNPPLVIGLCALIFATGIVVGVVFVPGVARRDSERIDLLEEFAGEAGKRVEIKAADDSIGVYSLVRGWKWRSTLRGAIDAHRDGGPAIADESARPVRDFKGREYTPVVGLSP